MPNVSVTFLCNRTIDGKPYQVYGARNSPTTMSAFSICGGQEDSSGAAVYIVVTVSVLATAIGFFIGMTSFKKTKYDEWDKQAGTYLHYMYERQVNVEKAKYKLARDSIQPQLDLITYLSGQRRSTGFTMDAASSKKAGHNSEQPGSLVAVASSPSETVSTTDTLVVDMDTLPVIIVESHSETTPLTEVV